MHQVAKEEMTAHFWSNCPEHKDGDKIAKSRADTSCGKCIERFNEFQDAIRKEDKKRREGMH